MRIAAPDAFLFSSDAPEGFRCVASRPWGDAFAGEFSLGEFVLPGAPGRWVIVLIDTTDPHRARQKWFAFESEETWLAAIDGLFGSEGNAGVATERVPVGPHRPGGYARALPEFDD